MNRRRICLILAVAAVLVVSTLCWLVPLSRTTQAAPAPSGDAAFKGKVLLVSTSNPMTAGFLLEKAQVQKIGDHSFLVGKGAADSRIGGWYKGRTVRLQMEHVISITEFDDLKEGKKALESGGGSPWGGNTIPAVPVEPGTPQPAPAAKEEALPPLPRSKE